MKGNIILLVLVIATSSLYAQENIAMRTHLDPGLAPFYHGVASGDPLTDRVIIWTRITPDQAGPVTVVWEIATDTGFLFPVANGSFITDEFRDYTVKVDVDQLQPDTWYYYRFWFQNRKSLTGRTRTAPVGDVDSLRFAVVSCSDYVDGYFNGYRRIAERNDIDAVIHLGDYIYENGSTGDIGRPHDPPERINELADYRQRYSQYHLDHDLQNLHQLFPFINVWDDHEVANNAWSGGAEAHDPATDGIYELRKRMAAQAYFEWIPIRKPDVSDSLRIYRSFQWGDLLDLFMIDSRIIGRDEQTTAANFDDTSRYMLGRAQLSWLSQEMIQSSAQWNVIGQQVMMAPLKFLGTPLNPDGWDGYKAERDRLYNVIQTNNLKNTVVLTGDIHTAWASNLEHNANPVGVEFVCSSITTQNSPVSLPLSLIQGSNPHIQYADLTNHGYYVLDINKERTQADYYIIGDITNPNDSIHTAGPFWYTDDSTQVLHENTQATISRSSLDVLKPSQEPPNPPVVGIEEQPTATLIGTYPNPFWNDFMIKTYLFEPENIMINIFDEKGALVEQNHAGLLSTGLHYIKINAKNLSPGTYLVQMIGGKKVFTRTAVKIY